MTAMTAISPASRCEPPVPYTDAAIKAGIAHEAANGPSHVRIKALGMMARLNGLFDQARYEARLAYEATRDALRDAAQNVTDQTLTGYERITELMNGAEVTEEDLGGFARFVKRNRDEEEDEEGSANDDDEPP